MVKAVRRCGSQQALADALNRWIRKQRLDIKPVVQQNISNWIRRDRRVPESYKPLLHKLANNTGTVK